MEGIYTEKRLKNTVLAGCGAIHLSVLVLRRLRQEDCEFRASLDYIVSTN